MQIINLPVVMGTEQELIIHLTISLRSYTPLCKQTTKEEDIFLKCQIFPLTSIPIKRLVVVSMKKPTIESWDFGLQKYVMLVIWCRTTNGKKDKLPIVLQSNNMLSTSKIFCANAIFKTHQYIVTLFVWTDGFFIAAYNLRCTFPCWLAIFRLISSHPTVKNDLTFKFP